MLANPGGGLSLSVKHTTCCVLQLLLIYSRLPDAMSTSAFRNNLLKRVWYRTGTSWINIVKAWRYGTVPYIQNIQKYLHIAPCDFYACVQYTGTDCHWKWLGFYIVTSCSHKTVFRIRIRIRRIGKFLGLKDPVPDPQLLVRIHIRIWIRITVLWLFSDLLSFKTDENVATVKIFLLAAWQPLMKWAGSGSRSVIQCTDPSASASKCRGSGTLPQKVNLCRSLFYSIV
jgi:hypothetical protein